MKTCCKSEKISLPVPIDEKVSSDTVFLDIETLGLSSSRFPIWLIGAARADGDPKQSIFTVTQWLSEEPGDEKLLLSSLISYLAGCRQIITFNGDTFDLPFIEKRAEKYGLSVDFSSIDSFDLYKLCRKLLPLLPCGNCKLKTIEQFLGIFRRDQLDGRELIRLYNENRSRPSEDQEQLLLLHNFEDVENLIRLLSISVYQKLAAIAPSDILSCDLIWEDECRLTYRLRHRLQLPKSIMLKTSAGFIRAETGQITGSLILSSKTHYLQKYDPSDYVWLIREKQLLPKALAASVAKKEKRPAQPEDCQAPAEGLFLPETDFISPDETVYDAGQHETEKWIRVDPGRLTEDFVSGYVCSLIRTAAAKKKKTGKK